MFTLYNVISEDWFIADSDGSEDFIPEELWVETLRVYGQFSTLLMGRKTYEAIQSYPRHLYESLEALDLRKIVITKDSNLVLKNGYEVMNSPEDALEVSDTTLVSSGPTLNNYLFQKNAVDKVILHEVRGKLEGGIPVFDEKYRSRLSLETESNIGLARELIFRVEQATHVIT